MAALLAWTAFLFVLMNLSMTARSAAAFGGHGSLTSSSTRTIGSQAIKAAFWAFVKRPSAMPVQSHGGLRYTNAPYRVFH
jgi:hypothetical protein